MSFYVYFISSLPMLHFGMKPPFSFEKFLELCRQFIPEEDCQLIEKCSIGPDYLYEGLSPTLTKWQDSDTNLRNELVKVRAMHKHLDAAKYLRGEEGTQTHLAHLALSAQRNPDIVEAERLLDQERWRLLEEFSFGHYFDLAILILYALKLLILERWERLNLADRPKALQEVMERIG